MTEREKLIEIIKQNGTYNGRSMGVDYYVVDVNWIVDLIFTNGFGDVSEWKKSNKILKKAMTSMSEDYCKDTGKKAFVIGNTTHYLSSAYTDSELCSIYLKQAKKEIEEERK